MKIVRSTQVLVLLLPILAWSGAPQASADQYRPPESKTGSDNILTVGPDKTYALPSEAARAAKQGDIIRIFPGLYTDCAQGHSTERISGKDENEFVNNVKRHLGMIHKGMAMPTRESILAMAKKA